MEAASTGPRELERLSRGVGALLPLPPVVDPEVVHRLGLVGRVLGRLLPFWDSGESAVAAKAATAGAAAAGGGGAVTAGSSVLGLGAAKLGVTAVCVAAATGGYVVCDQMGLVSGPLPRERHHVASTANVARKPPTRHAPSPAVIRAPAPITHTIRQAAAPAAPSADQRSSSSSASSSGQASGEFGFEGAGGTTGSAPASSPSSNPSARAASAGTQSTATTPSAPRKRPSGSGHRASTEFGFE